MVYIFEDDPEIAISGPTQHNMLYIRNKSVNKLYYSLNNVIENTIINREIPCIAWYE